ncbi:MAG: flippase [Candidatus Berkelbacteria bacterium]
MFNRKAILWNTFSQVLVRLVTLVLTLISIKILARYIGVEGVGNYNAITTYVNFFIVIADLGLFAVTVREIAKNPNLEKKIISNVFTIRAVTAALACLVVVGILFFTPYRHNPDIFYGSIIACGFLFFNLLGSVYDMVLQYRLQMPYSALAEFLSKFLSIVAIATVVTLRGNFLWVAATIAIYGLFIFVFKWLFSRQFIKFGFEHDRKFTKWILEMAWPMGIVFILNNLYFKLDTLMLYVLKGAAAVGIYSVSYKVLEVTAFIGSYFSSALKPALAQNLNTAEQRKNVARILKKSALLLSGLGLLIALICTAFSEPILRLISSDEFVAGKDALIVLSFTLPLIFLNYLMAEVMIAADKRKTMLKVTGFILLFNLILNLIFIPRYSYIAAAWTTLASELVLVVVNYIISKNILRGKVEKSQ